MAAGSPPSTHLLLEDEEEFVDQVPAEEDARHVPERNAVEDQHDNHHQEEHMHRFAGLKRDLLPPTTRKSGLGQVG